jgi:hypothetical protein
MQNAAKTIMMIARILMIALSIIDGILLCLADRPKAYFLILGTSGSRRKTCQTNLKKQKKGYER